MIALLINLRQLHEAYIFTLCNKVVFSGEPMGQSAVQVERCLPKTEQPKQWRESRAKREDTWPIAVNTARLLVRLSPPAIDHFIAERLLRTSLSLCAVWTLTYTKKNMNPKREGLRTHPLKLLQMILSVCIFTVKLNGGPFVLYADTHNLHVF